MLSSSGNYNCAYCSRHYKDKFYLNRHVATCQFLHKSDRERNADIDSTETTLPSTREMLSLIQTLVLRVDQCENKIAKLTAKLQQNRKINVVEWLTSREVQPTRCFIDWVREDMIPRVPDMLEVVYRSDLISAVVQLFTNTCSRSNGPLPIRMFEHRTNVVYLFQKGEEETPASWAAVPAATFDTYIGHICHQFIVEFNIHWYMVHKEEVASDESFKDMYVDYYKRILGGGKYSDDVLFAKIRAQIHSKMKQNVRSVEFT